MTGSLTVVGTGIRLAQITLETKGIIETSEKLLYLINDPLWNAGFAKPMPPLNHCTFLQ